MESSFKPFWIIVIFSFLFGKDYYISFSFSSLNTKLIYTKFNCSKALTASKLPKKFLFKIPCNKTIKKCCQLNQKMIIDKLLKNNIYIYSFNYMKNNIIFKNYSKLTFLPKRFDIILKDGYLYFYLRE